MRIFDDDAIGFWEENGYVVVPEAVPRENLEVLVSAIWEFLGMDPDNSDDLYKYQPYTKDNVCSPISQSGMVEIYQHQALWDNRQYPRVHAAFSQILGTKKLWVTLDRANMKPPAREENPEWCHPGMIHWDIDTSKQPIPFGVQGVLYLTDTSENQGGFQCIPGFHREFYDWVTTQPVDREPRFPDLSGLEVKSIPGKAGDLLIWHQLLAHGNGLNSSGQPRLAQYISMGPAKEDDEEERAARIRSWKERRAAPGWPGDPRDREHTHQKRAKLSALGRKLLGVESWNGEESDRGRKAGIAPTPLPPNRTCGFPASGSPVSV